MTERDEEVDLWFHPTGHLVLPFDPHRVQTDSPTVLGLEAGYDSVEVLYAMKNETDCTLNTEWNIRYEGVSTGREYEVSTSTLLAPGSIMHEIRTPGIAEDPGRLLRGIMLRHKGPSVDFISVYRDGHEPAVLKLVSQVGEPPRIQIATTGQVVVYCLDPKAGLIQEKSRNTEE
ncbi:MAG TPA: hypothetical protein DEA91_17910 [Paenibacillus sp.]|nr:hypothetical protein [Paenibacillus sp.]